MASNTEKKPRAFMDHLDPYGAYYFKLEINKVEVAHFQEVSGLKTSSEVFEIQEGGMNGMTHKRPGQSRYENLVLRYASSASQALLEWRDSILQDNFSRSPDKCGCSVSIVANNSETVVRRYEFDGAWPVSWEGPSLNSGSSELAIETLEIAYDRLWISK